MDGAPQVHSRKRGGFATSDGRSTPPWIVSSRRIGSGPAPSSAKTVRTAQAGYGPILWDRNRVRQLFGFEQILEIYKPAQERVYGYYCLPVLAGERLVARLDLKAERKTGKLHVLSCRFGGMDWAHPATAADQEATRQALCRYAAALDLTPAS